jgi:glucokinase
MEPSTVPIHSHAPLAEDVQDRTLLVGDLDGIQATLAVVSTTAGPRAPLAEASFPIRNYPSFTAIVREFLSNVNLPVQHACFDVAGPVVNGRATLRNLNWLVDGQVLASTFQLTSVRVLNDLEALACAVPHLEQADLLTVNQGIPASEGALAVIAPGVGLGEAFLIRTGSDYSVCASEGGHADFAPADDIQIELLQHMRSRFDHVSCERVCSESGIPYVYDFLSQSGRYYSDSPDLIAKMAGVQDRAPLIVDDALRAVDSSSLSVATLDLFLSILGAEAGNLALKVLASGVYLGGGISPRIQSLVRKGRFMQAFRSKGRCSGQLGRTPVHIIVNERASLLGAAYAGLAMGGEDQA